jgi:peptidoglycan hydrolase-like protein with peptidoglycan-binding domain
MAATAQTTPSAQPVQTRPLPAASWHGRPIRSPRADAAVVSAGGSSERASLRLGTGYGRPGGSDAVRAVQRLLHRIGYRCGPVDGLFGPRTRASVEWFQIKHGLRPTGRVDASLLALLRLRAAGGGQPAQARAPHGASPAGRLSPAPARAGVHPGTLPFAAFGGGMALLAILGGAACLRRLGQTSRPEAAPANRPRAVQPTPAGEVVGYASARDRQESRRRGHAIERVCSARGWTIQRIVIEPAAGASRHGRPGLAFALEHVSQGTGGRLVACRLSDLACTRRELGALLRWAERRRVDVVALDVGLDTGTSAGRVAARCLVAVIDERRDGHRRPPPAPAAARRREGSGADSKRATAAAT